MLPKPIYLDYAATTPVIPEVLQAMTPYFSDQFGNPNSSHTYGLEAKKALDKARSTIAQILNCEPSEIIFTSGGTESNNLAIFGLAKANKEKGHHIVSSQIEHSSIKAPLEILAKEDFNVSWVTPQKDGILEVSTIESKLTPLTTFASFIYANNEIGTIQNIPEISALLNSRGIIFHTDACQAAGAEIIDTKKLGVDLLTLNGSKIYGPKGVGLLYIKKGTPLTPLIYGGPQEFNLRSGTSNLPGIIGLAKALEIAEAKRATAKPRITTLRDYLITQLTTHAPGSKLNGHTLQRLPNNINITLPGLNAREMILHLDTQGICISAGSACETGKEEPSHVLKAIGLSDEEAKNTIRITLGNETTKEQLSITIQAIIKISAKLN